MTTEQRTDEQVDNDLRATFPASDPSASTPVVGVGSPAGRGMPAREHGTPKFGFALSSEESAPMALVHQAVLAERAGFDFLSISDHFHPWVSAQGNSPFVWSVIGGVAAKTDRVMLGTGVTCPILRIHPAIIAHAASTAAAMMEGRFYLGLGTGEALNEQVVGVRWPSARERLDRLEEAIEIIQRLFTGEKVNHDGHYYTVSDARLFTRPANPPRMLVAAAAPASARLAASVDGLIATGPDEEVFEAFESAGGREKPRIGQITVCWDEDEQRAKETARQQWPETILNWDSRSAIPTPETFEDATQKVTVDDVAEHIICGADAGRIVDAAQTTAARASTISISTRYPAAIVHRSGPGSAAAQTAGDHCSYAPLIVAALDRGMRARDEGSPEHMQ